MTTELKLPPGDRGLPWLGHTLPALRDIYGFMEARRARYGGSCFRGRVLGRDIAFVSGPEGAAAFLDEDKVTREQAHPTHVRELFGGINMNMYSGSRHFGLKSMALTAFDHQAIAGYLPDMQALVESTLARLARQPEFRGVDEMRRLSIEAICKNVMGIDPGPDADRIRGDYMLVTDGMLSVPIPLPGTTYTRARKARDRIFATFREMIAARRRALAIDGVPRDGLSRILAARMPDGRTVTDDEAALELHHIVIAGYIVFGLLCEVLLRLFQQPEVRAHALDEVRRMAGQGPLTLAQLIAMPRVERIAREAKRTAPILPLAFGRARRTFEIGGYTIPEGWGVWWALSLSNRNPDVFARPDVFDPDRYAEGRAEHEKHPHAWVPQGSGPLTGHKCLGFDYSTFLTQVFTVVLLRGYDWNVPAQNLTYFRNKTPAEPKDGLRATLIARADTMPGT